MAKTNAWRWGAFPREKVSGGAVSAALASALNNERSGMPGSSFAVGTYGGRVFALREAQSAITRAHAEECPCCGRPAVLVGCRSGYSAREPCRVQMPGETP